MKRETRIELQNILNDKTSGSEELLEKLNLFFYHHHSEFENITSLVHQIENSFSQFESIRKYLTGLKKVFRNKDKLIQYLNTVSDSSGNVFQKIFDNALPYLCDKKSILTISNSKTVLEILTRLNTDNKLLITICESRPRFEGRILARNLTKKGNKIRIITEAQSASYIAKCDCVINGADSILKNGSVVNKVGSLQLAILAKYFGKPFYVLASKEKSTNKKFFEQHKERSDEIWKTKTKNIMIDNFYFEIVPAKLITRIITN